MADDDSQQVTLDEYPTQSAPAGEIDALRGEIEQNTELIGQLVTVLEQFTDQLNTLDTDLNAPRRAETNRDDSRRTETPRDVRWYQ